MLNRIFYIEICILKFVKKWAFFMVFNSVVEFFLKMYFLCLSYDVEFLSLQ